MLKAFALIGVELMLVTATALFFSTFSSPFLSVALTFAVYIIGHFGEDLKNLDNLVESRAVASRARHLLRDAELARHSTSNRRSFMA